MFKFVIKEGPGSDKTSKYDLLKKNNYCYNMIIRIKIKT